MSLLPAFRNGIDTTFDTMLKEMDNLLSTPSTWNGNRTRDFPYVPAVDVVEEDNKYLISADMPGVSKKDIIVTAEDGILKISAERKSEKKEEKKGYQYYERKAGKFERKFKLTDDVDTNSIKAAYEDGVLFISIDKKEKAKPKTIQIS